MIEEGTQKLQKISITETDCESNSILVEKLLKELQELKRENRKLSNELEGERIEKKELERAKDSLTSEIEELTRNLFEEANGMVAIEAQARWKLEQSQKRLEAELGKTKEFLEMERDQTRILKSIVEEEKLARAAKDPILWDIDVFASKLIGSYYDDFFPGRSFHSKGGINNLESYWESLSDETCESFHFRQFSCFIDDCFKITIKNRNIMMNDDSILSVLNHQFMRNCLISDIEPCLSFPTLEKSGKLKSFCKKVLPSMLKNTCIIEPLNFTGVLNESVRSSPLSIKSFISIAPPVRSKTESPVKGGIPIDSHNSHSSNDDYFFSNSPASINSIESCPVSPTSVINSKCSLCDSSGNTHRFRINSPSLSSSSTLSSWNPICKSCRERLVSVASLFTILRHLLQGLLAHRPKLDIYFDFMQAKRFMFYSRSGVSQSFYALCDFEAFSKKICSD